MLLKWLILAVSASGKSRFSRIPPKSFITSTTGGNRTCITFNNARMNASWAVVVLNNCHTLLLSKHLGHSFVYIAPGMWMASQCDNLLKKNFWCDARQWQTIFLSCGPNVINIFWRISPKFISKNVLNTAAA